MNVPFTFPVAPEDFFAYQEKLTNQSLTEEKREILSEWIPLFNESFSAGSRNDVEWLTRELDIMDLFLKEHAASAFFINFLKVSRTWIAYAWKQGREAIA